jgi:hypothetical protein
MATQRTNRFSWERFILSRLKDAMTPLLLRRAKVSRRGGDWNNDDFDVFDGEQNVGRIYRINASTEAWFWGVKFTLTGRKSYGNAETLDEAKAMFKAEYERWKREG